MSELSSMKMSDQGESATDSSKSPCVIHPVVDWLFCGGLSIVVIIGVFVVFSLHPEMVSAFSYEKALQ